MQTFRYDVKKDIAYHRNGTAGEGFYVVKFTRGRDKFVAVAFDGDGQIAVLDRDLLAAGNITMGENSWRYEDFAHVVRCAIIDYDAYRTPRLAALQA